MSVFTHLRPARSIQVGDELPYGVIARVERWTHKGGTWVQTHTTNGLRKIHNGATEVLVRRADR